MRIFYMILLLLCSLNIQAQNISYVETTRSWYYIYDASGKKTGTLSGSVGELVGYGSEFLVVKTRSWYYLYDGKGRKLKGLSRSVVGEVVAVSGNTFTSRNGSWLYTWDKEGKKVSTRAAR